MASPQHTDTTLTITIRPELDDSAFREVFGRIQAAADAAMAALNPATALKQHEWTPEQVAEFEEEIAKVPHEPARFADPEDAERFQRIADRQSRGNAHGYTTADAIDAYEDHGVITPDEADKLREDEAAEALALGQLEALAREHVAIVKPGETLVVRCKDWTPDQAEYYQAHLDENADIPVLVVVGDELAVAQTQDAEPAGFMKDVRVSRFFALGATKPVYQLLHQPTGRTAESASLGSAVHKLGHALLTNGDITVNDARAAYGLPEFSPEDPRGC